jgi:hypothetical protein
MRLGAIGLSCLASFGAVWTYPAVVVHAQSPQRTVRVYSDSLVEGPETTVVQRVREVDAIIRCRVDRTEVRTLPSPDSAINDDPIAGIRVLTFDTVTVAEILKQNPNVVPAQNFRAAPACSSATRFASPSRARST